MSQATADSSLRARLVRLLGTGISAASRIGGQHGVSHYRVTLADGRSAFAKVQDQDSGRNDCVRRDAVRRAAIGFAAEAASLRWLAQAGAVPVPGVLASDDACLVIDWVEVGFPA